MIRKYSKLVAEQILAPFMDSSGDSVQFANVTGFALHSGAERLTEKHIP